MTLVEDVIKSKKQTSVSSLDIKMLIEETTNKSSAKKTRSVSETSEPEMMSSKKRSPRLSETSLECSEAEAELEAGVARLLEMFPTCCKVEAIHCLTIMGGDLERAAQMVLTRYYFDHLETQIMELLSCQSRAGRVYEAVPGPVVGPAREARDGGRDRNQEEDHGQLWLRGHGERRQISQANHI